MSGESGRRKGEEARRDEGREEEPAGRPVGWEASGMEKVKKDERERRRWSG